jgi:hypothetical protein
MPDVFGAQVWVRRHWASNDVETEGIKSETGHRIPRTHAVPIRNLAGRPSAVRAIAPLPAWVWTRVHRAAAP